MAFSYEELIPLVHDRPILWDNRLPNFYRQSSEKEDAWHEISQILGSTMPNVGDDFVQMCRAKWKIMRRRYVKELVKIKKNPTHKMSSLMKLLKFLDPVIDMPPSGKMGFGGSNMYNYQHISPMITHHLQHSEKILNYTPSPASSIHEYPNGDDDHESRQNHTTNDPLIGDNNPEIITHESPPYNPMEYWLQQSSLNGAAHQLQSLVKSDNQRFHETPKVLFFSNFLAKNIMEYDQSEQDELCNRLFKCVMDFNAEHRLPRNILSETNGQ